MIVDRFMDILVAEKGYSPHTCRAYRSDIMDFIGFFAGEQDNKDPAAENAQACDMRLQKQFATRVADLEPGDIKKY